MREHLLAWQWADYADKHGAPANLWLHLVAVPAFWTGTAFILGSPLHRSWLVLVAGLVLCVGSLAVQGRGHRLETNAPTPFLGPVDFATRFLAEQFVTFPRYVLTGGWRSKL